MLSRDVSSDFYIQMNAMGIVSGTPYTLIVRGTPTATCFQGKLYNWVYYTMASAASPINDSFEPYLMLPYDSRSYYAKRIQFLT